MYKIRVKNCKLSSKSYRYVKLLTKCKRNKRIYRYNNNLALR